MPSKRFELIGCRDEGERSLFGDLFCNCNIVSFDCIKSGSDCCATKYEPVEGWKRSLYTFNTILNLLCVTSKLLAKIPFLIKTYDIVVIFVSLRNDMSDVMNARAVSVGIIQYV